MLRYLIPLLLLAGCTAASTGSGQSAASSGSQSRVAMKLAGMSAGTPVHCIDKIDVDQIDTYPHTILYQVSRNKIYRNDVSPGCSGLKFGDLLVQQTIEPDRYCAGDFVHTRSRLGGGLSGSCTLGEFTPYTKGSGS